jgi:hypothetical protein
MYGQDRLEWILEPCADLACSYGTERIAFWGYYSIGIPLPYAFMALIEIEN